MDKYELHIRRATITNTDSQKRCYHGCHASSRIDWTPWELWIKNYTFETLEAAEHAAKLFCRENQEVKAVPVGEMK